MKKWSELNLKEKVDYCWLHKVTLLAGENKYKLELKCQKEKS